MATNIKFDSTDILSYLAPSTVTSGAPILVGGLLVVPLEDASTGALFSAQVRGRVYIPKTSAQAWSQGDQVYWTGTTTTNVQTGNLRAIGIAGEAAANPSSYGYVDLGVGVEADSDMGTFKADLASTTDAAKGTALIGDNASGGTLKAKLDTCLTAAAAATGAGSIATSAGASRAISYVDTVTLTGATAGTGAKVGLAEPTGGGASVISLEAPALAASCTLTLPAASRDFANIPSMAANGTAGNLIGTAGADKALSDSGVVTANVVTNATGNASAAQVAIAAAGASKAIKPVEGVAFTAAAAGAGGGAKVLLSEETGSGVNTVSLEAPDTLAGNIDVTLPTTALDMDVLPRMAAVGGVGTLVQTAAADRAQSDSGVVAANVVTQAANAAGAGTIPAYAGASKVLTDSLVVAANVPQMAAVGGAGNLLQTAAADRAVSDAGIAVANVPTQAAVATAAQQVLVSAGADKTQKALVGVTATAADAGAGASLFLGEATAGAQTVEILCPAVLTGNRQLTLPDRSIDLGNTVTQAADAAGAGTIPAYAGASKVLTDSLVPVANVPTMAAVGGAGNLIQTAAADRAQSDSGIPVANVPQMAAVGGVGTLVMTAAADRAQSDSGITKANVQRLIAAVTLPAGPLADGGTNAISIDIQATDPTGAALGHVTKVTYSTSAAAFGAHTALCDQATTATTGTIATDATVADGDGEVWTDATGHAVIVLGHVAGALNVHLSVVCAGQTDDVLCQFA